MSEIRSRGVLARAQPAVIVPTNPAQVASGRRHCATVGVTVPTKPANPSALLCTGWHGTGSGSFAGRPAEWMMLLEESVHRTGSAMPGQLRATSRNAEFRVSRNA